MPTQGGPGASLAETHTLPLRRTSVLRLQAIHRRLRGDSRGLLVSGSDGGLYVLKMVHSRYTASMRASEALAGLLAARLGLPVAVWHPMQVGDAMGLWRSDCPARAAEGREEDSHYACQIRCAEGEDAIIEIIPRAWHTLVTNRADFVGMAIFDLWTSTLQHPRSIFVSGDPGIRVIFIDHSLAFGGPGQRNLMAVEDALYYEHAIYGDLWTREVTAPWLDRIRNLSMHEVHAHIDRLPSSWVSESWRYGVTALLEALKATLAWKITRVACLLRNRGGEKTPKGP